MTICAALIFSSIYIVKKRKGIADRAFGITALAFWGAALMWLIDCIFSAAQGESFFDLSKEDAVLGGIIILCGIGLFGVLKLFYAKRGSLVKNDF